LQFKLF